MAWSEDYPEAFSFSAALLCVPGKNRVWDADDLDGGQTRSHSLALAQIGRIKAAAKHVGSGFL